MTGKQGCDLVAKDGGTSPVKWRAMQNVQHWLADTDAMRTKWPTNHTHNLPVPRPTLLALPGLAPLTHLQLAAFVLL
jgi:hypothetical protein